MQTYFLHEQHMHDKSSMVIKQCTVSFNKLINSKEKKLILILLAGYVQFNFLPIDYGNK